MEIDCYVDEAAGSALVVLHDARSVNSNLNGQIEPLRKCETRTTPAGQPEPSGSNRDTKLLQTMHLEFQIGHVSPQHLILLLNGVQSGSTLETIGGRYSWSLTAQTPLVFHQCAVSTSSSFVLIVSPGAVYIKMIKYSTSLGMPASRSRPKKRKGGYVFFASLERATPNVQTN